MINIIYTILLFNILIIVFKMFEKYKVDNLQALIVNYLTAAGCSYFFLEQDFSLNHVLNAKWLYHAMIIGTLFIIVFNFYAFGTQKVGIAVTTVANKMSLIIPVFAALILYPENNTFNELKGIGFFLALAGIYLSSTKAGKLSLPPLVEDKYIPASAKKNAIPFNASKVLFSGYKISAAQTGIIKDILFATVVTAIPAFCVPNA